MSALDGKALARPPEAYSGDWPTPPVPESWPGRLPGAKTHGLLPVVVEAPMAVAPSIATARWYGR